MTRKPFFKIPLTFSRSVSWTVLLSIALLGFSPVKAIAQVLFEPPPGEEEPKIAEGGAGRTTRSSPTCIVPGQDLRVLKPSGLVGLTLEEHPTVWIELPPNTAERMALSVLTESGGVVYDEITFPVPETPGVVALPLPADGLPLEIGKRYRWEIELECEIGDFSNNPSVSGWVKRVEPDAEIADELASATDPIAEARVYGRHGIWYETLNLVAQQRQEFPQDARVQAAWESLLEWVEPEPADDGASGQDRP